MAWPRLMWLKKQQPWPIDFGTRQLGPWLREFNPGLLHKQKGI